MLSRPVPALLALPLILLALAFAACGDDSEEQTDGGDAQNGGSASGDAIDLSAADFSFSPATIDAQAGEEITIHVTNTGNAPHTFTIDSLGIDETLQSGEETTVSLTVSGNKRFYCRFHESAGMEGSISTGDGAAGGEATPTEAAGNEFSY